MNEDISVFLNPREDSINTVNMPVAIASGQYILTIDKQIDKNIVFKPSVGVGTPEFLPVKTTTTITTP